MTKTGKPIKVADKTCTKCKITKSVESFHKDSRANGGIYSSCIECKKQYKSKNAESIKLKAQQYYAENVERLKETQSAYYYANNKKVSARQLKYYHDNKEVRLEKQKKYNKENRSSITKKQTMRSREDINFRLGRNLRRRLHHALRGTNKKCGSAVRELGCTVEQLKLHLESKFENGMGWHNYGAGENKWNVDHKLPVSQFDLTDPNQLKIVCHYTNLQPMWSVDNIRKGNKIL